MLALMRRKVLRAARSPILIEQRLFAPLTALARRWLLRARVRLHGGRLEVGRGVRIEHPTLFQGQGKLILGDRVVLGSWLAGATKLPILLQPREAAAVIRIEEGTIVVNGCELIARESITLGANCRIGPRCVIYDSDFHSADPKQRDLPGESREVVIGDNVWLGAEVMILKGVHIGRDSVIGARAVVTKDISEGAVAVGNPARVVASVSKVASISTRS